MYIKRTRIIKRKPKINGAIACLKTIKDSLPITTPLPTETPSPTTTPTPSPTTTPTPSPTTTPTTTPTPTNTPTPTTTPSPTPTTTPSPTPTQFDCITNLSIVYDDTGSYSTYDNCFLQTYNWQGEVTPLSYSYCYENTANYYGMQINGGSLGMIIKTITIKQIDQNTYEIGAYPAGDFTPVLPRGLITVNNLIGTHNIIISQNDSCINFQTSITITIT